MQRQPPIVRCFVALCFGSAVTLAAFEWRSPFPEPVVTPDSVANISSTAIFEPGNDAEQSGLAARPRFGQLFAREALPKADSPSEASSVQLVLSLDLRSLEVRYADQPTVRYEVAVGQADWKTPTGEFKIINKIENPAWQHPITKDEIPPGPDNPLGTRWIGFWSDGQAQIGFHGTNQEELIGEAVSHGCVRMRNRDIQDLYQRVEVGTAVKVEL